MFTVADLKQMETLGISEVQALDQIETFKKSSFFVHLNRPCTLDDGISRILPDEIERYFELHQEAAEKGRFLKFVPASGAATRMFQSLLQIYYLPQYLDVAELHSKAIQGVSIACDFVRFIEEIRRFPFIDDLEQAASKDGLSLEALVQNCQYRTILDYLLSDRGLNYGTLPKGLLKFHRYPAECRTAFEEHLIEAAHYLGNGSGTCKVHFTVSPEHEPVFMALLERVRRCYEERYATCYDICFSFQKPSTNTIAVDLEDRPFRDRSGRLHFRPGGHGALLENLSELEGDLVYIKNVDNLTPDHLRDSGIFWKRVLGGFLLEIQETVHGYLRALQEGVGPGILKRCENYAREKLLIYFPKSYEYWPQEEKRTFLAKRLNRPIRVCGVVPNVGEPGGAPFWVDSEDGSLSLQIVEKAQVDFTSPVQRNIWMSSTHFNPVDLVCGLRDYEGKPFELKSFVDKNAVFISKKSKDGRDLKALELPGLWNGSMADWITVMVEVPILTFNPVKTVYDLLRPEHQMGPH
jgi:hypothetical protein